MGGGLALLNGVMYNFDGVRAFQHQIRLICYQMKLKQIIVLKKYDGKFINYLHRSDIIGNSDLFAQRIGTQIYGKDVGRFSLLNPILGHGMDTFEFKV